MSKNIIVDGQTLQNIQTINAHEAETHNLVPYVDTSDGTATADDILTGKSAYVNGQKINGAFVDRYLQIVAGTITNVKEEDFAGLTSIRNGLFWDCTALQSVVTPNNITHIRESAFRYCNHLSSYINCPIYVPAESVESYKTATGWSTYASRIQAIQE